jgi:hypothetical protein
MQATVHLAIPGINRLAYHDEKLIAVRLWLLNAEPTIHSEFQKGLSNWGHPQQDWLSFEAELEPSTSDWQRILALTETQWKQLQTWLNDGSLMMQVQDAVSTRNND